MENVQPARSTRKGRGALETIAHVSIIVLTISFVGTSVMNWFAQQAARSVEPGNRRGVIPYTAYANAQGAHFVFTNDTPFARWSCVKATLTNTDTKQSIQSFPVCTGELSPHASVVLESAFRGEIKDVCGKYSSSLGRMLDWDECKFDTSEAGEGERANGREAPATKGERRKRGDRAAKATVLTWGDLASRLKGRRAARVRSERSAEAVVADRGAEQGAPEPRKSLTARRAERRGERTDRGSRRRQAPEVQATGASARG